MTPHRYLALYERAAALTDADLDAAAEELAGLSPSGAVGPARAAGITRRPASGAAAREALLWRLRVRRDTAVRVALATEGLR